MAISNKTMMCHFLSNDDSQPEILTMKDQRGLKHEFRLFQDLNSQFEQELVNLSKFSINDLVDREQKLSRTIGSYNQFLAKICQNSQLDVDWASNLFSLQSSFNEFRKNLKNAIEVIKSDENGQQSNPNLKMLEKFQRFNTKNLEKKTVPEECSEVIADNVHGYQPSIISDDNGKIEKLDIHKYWQIVLEVFLKNGSDKNSRDLARKFRYNKLEKFQELSLAEQENVIEYILEISVKYSYNQAEKMLFFCQEVAQMFGFKSAAENLIKNWLKKYYESPIYHDLKNYHQRLEKIEKCQDSHKKIILESQLETEKLALRKRYLACLQMIGKMFDQQNVSIDFVSHVINHLLNQAMMKSIEADDYFGCFLKFFNLVGARYQLEPTRLGNNCAQKYEDIYFKIRRIQMYSHSKFSAENLKKLAQLINSMEKGWPDAQNGNVKNFRKSLISII